VLLDRVELAPAAAEELQHALAAVAAEADRLAAKDLAASQVEAVLADIGAREQRLDLGAQLGGHQLVGLEQQHPLVAQRQLIEPPLEDPRDDAAVLVGERV